MAGLSTYMNPSPTPPGNTSLINRPVNTVPIDPATGYPRPQPTGLVPPTTDDPFLAALIAQYGANNPLVIQQLQQEAAERNKWNAAKNNSARLAPPGPVLPNQPSGSGPIEITVGGGGPQRQAANYPQRNEYAPPQPTRQAANFPQQNQQYPAASPTMNAYAPTAAKSPLPQNSGLSAILSMLGGGSSTGAGGLPGMGFLSMLGGQNGGGLLGMLGGGNPGGNGLLSMLGGGGLLNMLNGSGGSTGSNPGNSFLNQTPQAKRTSPDSLVSAAAQGSKVGVTPSGYASIDGKPAGTTRDASTSPGDAYANANQAASDRARANASSPVYVSKDPWFNSVTGRR